MLRLLKIVIFKIFLYLICLSFLACLIPSAVCNAIDLVWNANPPEDSVAGYRVYYSTSSSGDENYTLIKDVGNVTEYTLEGPLSYLEEQYTYHFAVTAYDGSNNESDYSEEEILDGNDGISSDNCQDYYNPDQEDTFPPDGNGIGDACDCEGNFDCDGDVDGKDMRTLKLFNFGRSTYKNPCTSENPCEGDFDCDGDVDGVDLRVIKKDFARSPYSIQCPPCSGAAWCSY